MGRLTFDDLTPDDMPSEHVEHWGDRADDFRDSLGDLVRCGIQTTNGVKPMPNYTQNELLAVRPDGAVIEATDDNAFMLAAIATDMSAAYVVAGYDGDLDEDKMASLWCFDPADTFGGFDDDVARVGCDEELVREIKVGVWDLLPHEVHVKLLAHQFAAQVRDALDPPDLDEVIRRNKTAAGPVCHSHDFIDSNECMLAALDSLGIPFMPDDQDQCNLTNDAWRMAKAGGFGEVYPS